MKIEKLTFEEALAAIRSIPCFKKSPTSDQHFIVGETKYVVWVGLQDKYWKTNGNNCMVSFMNWKTQHRTIVNFEEVFNSCDEGSREDLLFNLDLFR
jgi:hypothetical protein